MSFPQTQAIIDAIKAPAVHPAAEAAATLLGQYRQLTATLEGQTAQIPTLQGQIEALQLQASLKDERIAELEGQIAELHRAVATMEGHPDVKAAALVREKERLVFLQQQEAITQKRIEELEGRTSPA